MIDKKQLIEMQNETNKLEMKELEEVKIDPNLPINERADKFFEQIKNPYNFLVHGVPVTIKFNNHIDRTLDNCLINYFQNKN